MSIACIRITAYYLKDLTATWFASQLEMIGTGICSEWIEYDVNCTLLNRCHFCNNIGCNTSNPTKFNGETRSAIDIRNAVQ